MSVPAPGWTSRWTADRGPPPRLDRPDLQLWPLSIGGKTDCDQRDVGCDYYAGDLDWVEIEAR